MKARGKFLALPAAGAGGDLQPLLALVSRLRERGHDLVVFGNPAVASAEASLDVETMLSAPEHDLGPRLIAAVTTPSRFHLKLGDMRWVGDWRHGPRRSPLRSSRL